MRFKSLKAEHIPHRPIPTAFTKVARSAIRLLSMCLTSSMCIAFLTKSYRGKSGFCEGRPDSSCFHELAKSATRLHSMSLKPCAHSSYTTPSHDVVRTDRFHVPGEKKLDYSLCSRCPCHVRSRPTAQKCLTEHLPKQKPQKHRSIAKEPCHHTHKPRAA